MQSIVADGWSKEVKMYIMDIFESSKATGTMDTIWKPVVWSLRALAAGKWPSSDVNGNPYLDPDIAEYKMAGKPLAGGLKCVLWSIKADLDALNKAFYLPHYASNKPCAFCGCDRNPDNAANRFNNFRPDADWKHNVYTAAAWSALPREKCTRSSRSPTSPLITLK